MYVAEAHPSDEWLLASNEDGNIRVVQQTTLEERIARRAGDAAARLSLTMPILVDGMDDAASIAFAAWPERLVVIDRDGRIATRVPLGRTWLSSSRVREPAAHLADITP